MIEIPVSVCDYQLDVMIEITVGVGVGSWLDVVSYLSVCVWLASQSVKVLPKKKSWVSGLEARQLVRCLRFSLFLCFSYCVHWGLGSL